MSLKSTSLVTNVLIYPSLHFDTDHLFCPRPFIAHSSFFFNNSLCDINLLMTEKLFLDRGHTLTYNPVAKIAGSLCKFASDFNSVFI